MTLTAEKSDSLGVAPDGAFLLRSPSGISSEIVRQRLTVTPSTSFKATSRSGNEVEIRFDEPLKGGAVYRFRFDVDAIPGSDVASAAGTEEGNSLSWAFQTKKVFGIEKTLPANKATSVPLNAGIEVTFTDERFRNEEESFHIEPAVKGKFERHHRTLVFIPEALSPKTIYVVTMSAGIGADGSDEKTVSDTVFRFETASADTSESGRSLLFSDNWFSSTAVYQFGKGERPALSITASGFVSDPSAVDVSAFRFPDENAYLSALGLQAAIPAWTKYARSDFQTDASGLQKVITFHANLEDAGWKRYFAFPDTLPEGYYLVEAETDGVKTQGFIQVTDLAVYASVSDTETTIWANDTGNTSPVAGAVVEIVNGDRRESLPGKTDEHGLMTVNTPDSLKGEVFGTTFFRIASADGKSVTVPVDNNTNMSDGASPRSAGYWSYLYLDRDMYQPTDTLAFWGVIRKRDTQVVEKRTLKVVVDGKERKVETSEWGTFIGEIPIQELPVGYYSANVYLEGDDPETAVALASVGFSVETYVKPSYQIVVTPEKTAGLRSARFSATAKFFDGTPVSAVQLSTGEKTMTTDTNGQVTFDESLPDIDTPQMYWANVTPASGEEGDIFGSAGVAVFPSSVTLVLDESRSGLTQHVSLGVAQVDFAKAEQNGKEDPSGSWLYTPEKSTGAPVPGATVRVDMEEVTYEKTEDGGYYDFIEKKTVKRYTYEEKRQKVPVRELMTGADGKASIDFALQDGKAYNVIFETKDAEGGKTVLSRYYYGYSPNEDPDFILTSDEGSGHRYRLNESATAIFKKSDDSTLLASGKFLFYRAQRGTRDATVQDDPTYRFQYAERDIPNIEVRGIMFTGKTYIERLTSFTYDTEERKLSLSVSSDKNSYRPGETVNLGVSVKDAEGNGRAAKVNLSAVDEAQLAIAPHAPALATDWSGLYKPVGSGIIAAYSSHQYPVIRNMAEKGGCFLAGTPIRMADGSEKPIESVVVGDSVSSRAGESDPTIRSGAVTQTFEHIVDGYLIIDGFLRVTPEHDVFANGQWMTAGELRVGDSLLGIDNGWKRISSIERRGERVAVYNLSVDTYHTYFAGGVYVHNSKGRDVFLDRVLFTEIDTDKNGNGKTSFQVPDNLTSWRVAAQALTEDIRVGQSQDFSVPVSLPFFVLPTISDTYVVGDKPVLSLRSFGTGLSKGDRVEFSVESESLGLRGNVSGVAFESTDMALPSLSEGTHKIVISGKSGDKEDSLTRTIRVVPEGTWHTETASFPVAIGTDFRPGEQGRTTITFGERGMSTALAELWKLATNESARFDGLASGAEAKRLLNEHFGENLGVPASGDWDPFIDGTQGYKLIPYGNADLYTTAFSGIFGTDSPLPASNTDILRSTLDDTTASRESVATALLGLAARGEPVLLDVDRLLTETDLSVREKLLLGVAEAVMGNGERAKQILYEALGGSGGDSVELSISNGKISDVDEEKNTALGAVIAILSGAPEADRLFSFVSAHPSPEDPLFLERAVFLNAKLRHAPKQGDVSVAYTLNGKREERTIARGETFALSLLQDEVRALKIEDVKGEIGATVIRTVAAKSGSGGSLSSTLRRSYNISGRSEGELHPGDLVSVELAYSLGAPAEVGSDCLSVVDTLPAGLKVVTSWATIQGQQNGEDILYPYAIEGQRVKFCAPSDWKKPITYLARVAEKGDFSSPGVIMEARNGSRFKVFPAARIKVR